jgi:hypothetical protein
MIISFDNQVVMAEFNKKGYEAYLASLNESTRSTAEKNIGRYEHDCEENDWNPHDVGSVSAQVLVSHVNSSSLENRTSILSSSTRPFITRLKLLEIF